MTSQTFTDLGVPAPLIAVLAEQGKNEPFPIQADTPARHPRRARRARPRQDRLRQDPRVLAAARRAPGREERPPPRTQAPRARAAPTRELANQIDEVIKPLAAAYDLTTTTVYGGVNQKRQVDALNAGVDILVACPGRLEDLIGQGFANLDAIEITVLDEADHMADLGFLPGVTRLLARTPADGQRLLFSATLDNGVDKLVKRFLRNEVLHSVDEAHSHVAAMTHHVFVPADADAKKQLVRTLASGTARRILFMRTKHQAKKLAKELTAAGIPSVDLHGNLSQPARDRNLAAFGDGRAKVLVATDVAARGVHVDGVELVVHVDPPVEHKAYLHRSGRTARAGSAGDVVTIMLPEQRRDNPRHPAQGQDRRHPAARHLDLPEVVALVGEVAAPYVKPEPIVAQPQGGGRSQGANAQRKRAARGQDPRMPPLARPLPVRGVRRRGRGAGQAAPAPTPRSLPARASARVRVAARAAAATPAAERTPPARRAPGARHPVLPRPAWSSVAARATNRRAQG